MTTEPAQPRSRRALLAGGLGAGVAALAASLGRPSLVDAGSDGDVVFGGVGTASSVTRITNVAVQGSAFPDAIEGISTNGAGIVGTGHTAGVSGTGTGGGAGVRGDGGAGGVGVAGLSGSAPGVTGSSTSSNGVHGFSHSSNAIFGESDQQEGVTGSSHGASAAGVHGASFGSSGMGVFGNAFDTGSGTTHGGFFEAKSSGGIGVYGRNDKASGATRGVQGEVVSSTGTGVRGVSTSGTALAGAASAAAGFALKTSGRLSFGKVSGVATISAGKTASAAIATGTDITTGSYVLLTPQKDPGTRRFWAVLSATANTVTIKTNAPSTSSIRIAWLLVG